jgi:hypothetical protein
VTSQDWGPWTKVHGYVLSSLRDRARFTADLPDVGAVLTGTGRVAHFEANAGAILGSKLPPEIVQRAIDVFGPASRNASF